jgi:uncharacterized Tic20 family protein
MSTDAVTQESRNAAVLIWVATIFLGFIPGLIVYLVKKDDPYILDQAVEALNWSITAMIGYVAATILKFVFIGTLAFAAVWICHLVVCVMGAVGCSNGTRYRAPFALRLIK